MDNSEDKIRSSGKCGVGELTTRGERPRKFRPRSEKARAVRTGGEERIWKEVKGNKIVKVSQASKFNTETLRPLMRKRSKILHKIKKDEMGNSAFNILNFYL